jgi:dGTPase
MATWEQLLCAERFADILERPKPKNRPDDPAFAQGQFRLAQERDHDRILFSTPFRRMGDKTQVFPLESIESIRTRLTHSYEVANLARSLGTEIADSLTETLPKNAHRTIPSILAAAGLAHDIGNPPFGHQGELAIRSWFKRNTHNLFETSADTPIDVADDVKSLTEQHKNDFLNFEGNAQTLRVVTKLQVIGDDLGLNLTISTLASLMKYVAASNEIDKNIPTKKKVGFFASEQQLVQTIRQKSGLQGNSIHPLALVMEACDDIAYSVLDAEDAIKKGIVSINDLLAYIKNESESKNPPDEPLSHLHKLSHWELNELKQQKLHPNELQDVATQKFRVHAIHLMICAAADFFKRNHKEIIEGRINTDLISASRVANICSVLKTFNKENTFSHKTILEVELNGYNTINRLMDFLWMGISDREEYRDPESKRKSPFSSYVYGRISKNHRRIFEGEIKSYHKDIHLPIRYREMQLLTDMISGMTDQFCIDLHNDLLKHYREFRTINARIA